MCLKEDLPIGSSTRDVITLKLIFVYAIETLYWLVV